MERCDDNAGLPLVLVFGLNGAALRDLFEAWALSSAVIDLGIGGDLNIKDLGIGNAVFNLR